MTTRGALRELRHLPDRLLHGVRGRRARRRIRELRDCTSVLIICHGNICRSPYAAAFLRAILARNGIDSIEIDSAGFVGPGRNAPSHARGVARERGINLDAHISKLLTQRMATASDLIIVMDRRQSRAIKERFEPEGSVLLLGDLDPGPIRRRAIQDPYNQTDGVFRSVYTRVECCVSAMAEALGETRATD